jgi:hypothetical protein
MIELEKPRAPSSRGVLPHHAPLSGAAPAGIVHTRWVRALAWQLLADASDADDAVQ